jgi:glycolate oxidase iron-sulfur subunit
VTGRETLTARGKLHLLATELADSPSSHFQDIFARCLLCGACEDNCSRQLPIREQIVQARSAFPHLYGRHPLKRALVRMALSKPALLEGLVRAGLSLSRLSLLPAESGLRIKLGLLEDQATTGPGSRDQQSPAQIPGKTGLSYFSGCLARYLQPSISEATVALAGDVTGQAPYAPDAQVCCGLAAWSAGRIEEARALARKNIEAFAQAPGPILTSCASCSSHLLKYPTLFADDPQWREKAETFSRRVKEFTSFMNESLPAGKLEAVHPARVYYHEPCHLRFAKGHRGAAVQLLGKISNTSLINSAEGSHCCGQGGLFHLGYPELADKIFSQAYDQLSRRGANVVLTTCSGCLMQWQAGLATRHSRVPAVHLAVWLRSNMQING